MADYSLQIFGLPGKSVEDGPAVVELSRDLLRLLLAGQAMAGYIAAHAHPDACSTPEAPLVASSCASYADALLAALEAD